MSSAGKQSVMNMRITLILGVLVLFTFAITADVAAQNLDDSHMNHMSDGSPESLNPETVQDWAKKRLEKSPRHQEWVKITNGNRVVNSFVVYPEVKTKATAIIVIHEIFGMSDWVQILTDQLAEAGYIAIAPDLLSGMGPNGGGTSSFDANGVRQAIGSLPPDQITADLNAVAEYVSKLPSANGKVVVTGYCWGGGQSFRFATNRPAIKAAFVFYGPPPSTADGVDKTAIARIQAPVYGFYAGNDMRINATLPATIEATKELNKTFDPVTYDGAGHGFMRAGDAPEPTAPAAKGDKEADDKAAADYQKALVAYKANKKARDDAWVRWKAILAKI
jgi:carboxymethylenebutenolidase